MTVCRVIDVGLGSKRVETIITGTLIKVACTGVRVPQSTTFPYIVLLRPICPSSNSSQSIIRLVTLPAFISSIPSIRKHVVANQRTLRVRRVGEGARPCFLQPLESHGGKNIGGRGTNQRNERRLLLLADSARKSQEDVKNVADGRCEK